MMNYSYFCENLMRPRQWWWVVSSILALALVGCSGAQQVPGGATLSVVEAVNAEGAEGFARVTEPRTFVFPHDHGPHPEYQTEWWYYTGNLQAESGRRFGFQLTFFRSALTAEPVQRDSEWAAANIYMAHLGLSDIADEQFYSFDRFSRGGPGLAGAIGDPFIVFLEDWSAVGTGPESMTMRLRAAEGPIAIDLTLESTRAPVLQGNQGLSQKGEEQGNASYYYSLTRMATSGNIRIAGDTFAVDGLSWMDHEFGTSALEEGAIGWDWFSLQLDSGHDLMLYRIRHTNPQKSVFFGVLVAPDGSTQRLAPADVRIEALATWQSPRSGAVYPARWQLAVPPAGLVLEVVPLLADQEMATAVVYWEGAVQVSGTRQGQPVQGHGYVELTGYADAGETVLAD